jgi:zinc protease
MPAGSKLRQSPGARRQPRRRVDPQAAGALSSAVMKRQNRIAVLAVALLLLAAAAFPQAREVTGYRKVDLDNGLELFILENHVVPLARIEITFRCGSIAQTADTAGLFHLYEHMLFKGNRVYRSQSEFQVALKELGVASWNGSTSPEAVTYYITVPSDRVEKGIEFWANAVCYPLLEASELETEKDVVANEVRGSIADPALVFESAVDKALYWKYPWRRDVVGSEKSIRAATVQVMRDIRDTWYVPNNTALFVGGDVDPAAVLAAVKKHFGDWRKRGDPWASPPPAHPATPKDALLVYPDEQMYQGVAFVEILFRGPDVLADPGATYAADVWGKFLEDPNGRFKASIWSKVPDLYKKEYLWASYSTQRDGGYITFSTYLLVSSQKSTFERLADLKKAIAEEIAAMTSDQSYFSPKDYEILKSKLADERIYQRETVDGFVSDLSFWWASASTAYYDGYVENLKRAGFPQLRRFLSDYVASRTSVLAARMNPKDFAREQPGAEKAGFSVITRDNAFWWAGK